MGKFADNIFIATGSYDKAKEKYTLELTRKELCAIYNWMCCGDDCGVDSFMSNDKDIKALVKRIVEAYNG